MKSKKPLHPTTARQRQQLAKDKLLADIETLTTQADQLPPGDERDTLVCRIEELTVEYQSGD
jgi:hypothetical protein